MKRVPHSLDEIWRYVLYVHYEWEEGQTQNLPWSGQAKSDQLQTCKVSLDHDPLQEKALLV